MGEFILRYNKIYSENWFTFLMVVFSVEINLSISYMPKVSFKNEF